MRDSPASLLVSLRIPLIISIAYGSLASLLYLVAGYTPGGGRLGAWYVLYFVAWPASWLANQFAARLEGHIPDKVFGFLYVAAIIVAGMLWFFLVALAVKFVLARLKRR